MVKAKKLLEYAVVLGLGVILISGCPKKSDPITGTWTGTAILKDIDGNTDTSDLKMILENDKGDISGNVTAFEWNNIEIRMGAYVEGADPSFSIETKPIEGAGSLYLTGNLEEEDKLSGHCSTTDLRSGTWQATRGIK